MQEITIYHNPRCSKSRDMLKYLQDNGYKPEVVNYMDSNISEEEYFKLFEKLENTDNLIRKNENEYKELPSKPKTIKEIAEAIHKYPRIMQRPILLHKTKAIVARPEEDAYQWLQSL